MKPTKTGDLVKVTGTTAGNPIMAKGTLMSQPSSRPSALSGFTVRDESTQTNWTVYYQDMELYNPEAEKAFASKFLNREAKNLLKDGYLEVTIRPSQKMKDEMEALAIDTFIEKYKAKK